MIQNNANVYDYATNTISLNNIPKPSACTYSYDEKEHTIVDNFFRDFKFDN